LRGILARLVAPREHGQVLILFAVTIPVLLGMTGMAVDLGAYAADRRDLQNASDAAALAAARELPDAGAAEAAAHAWGLKNGIAVADMDVAVSGGTSAPRVRVVIEEPHEFYFMKIVGLDESDVSGAAAAIKASFGGGAGVVPWSLTQATVDWAEAQGPGTEVTLKYGAGGSTNGNFGAIRIDGNGASDYEDAIKYGSDSALCSVSAPNCTLAACPGSYPATCSEDSSQCDGPECPPKTGNMAGPTRDGVQYRMDNTKPGCDSFGETFAGPDANGKYGLNSDCNPWQPAGACPEPDTNPPAKCSRRIIVIPVIDSFGNGSSDPVEIQRFALVYLTGLNCSGNGQGQCEVRGIFVKADITTNALAGAYDPEASIQFTRLAE
jgi:hypothetical protein